MNFKNSKITRRIHCTVDRREGEQTTYGKKIKIKNITTQKPKNGSETIVNFWQLSLFLCPTICNVSTMVYTH